MTAHNLLVPAGGEIVIRRRTTVILAAVAFPLAVIGYFALISLTAGVLTISTDKAAYQQGETITFTVRNNWFSVLEFPNPGLGFRIMNVDTGEYVSLDRLYPQVIHYMNPLAWETTTWDQKELTTSEEKLFDHRNVKPGNYVASVGAWQGSDGSVVVAEVRFRIS